MRRRASEKDHQSEIRTKVPDEAFDQVAAIAEAEGRTMYAVARDILRLGLTVYPTRSAGTGTQNPGPSQDFGNRE